VVVESGWVERQAVNLALDEADDRAHLREGAVHHAVVLGLAGEPPVDREDDDRVELPRIGFGFDRKSYGRLRELIDRLNAL